MGIIVTVKVEGEEQSLIENQTDGKPLADIVAGWIWFPEVVKLFGLSPASTKALQKIDDSAYGEDDEEPKNVWQDPADLKIALEELQTIYQRIRTDPSLIEKVDIVSKGNATNNFKPEWYEGYIQGIEDAIKTCEIAAQRAKRVCLVAE